MMNPLELVYPNPAFVRFLIERWNVTPTQESPVIPDVAHFFSGKTSLFSIYCFAQNVISWAQIRLFLKKNADAILAVCRENDVDLYAQSSLDAAPVVVREFSQFLELESLAQADSFPELTFELDRRFGKKKLESRFVSEFRKYMELLAKRWTGIPENDPELRMKAALLTMLRLFFVAFLQARGILDGRCHFMMEEASACVQSEVSIYRNLIEPLFFETLNRAENRRTKRARAFGHIPFLNGGLFTPSEFEKNHPALSAPNDFWMEVLSNLFERYTLASDHANLQERLSLDPMMLGHVYEKLMIQKQRASTGSYYTPMPLARQLVTESFKQWFCSKFHLSETQSEAICLSNDCTFLSRENALEMEKALSEITILDPAVGSGAFLQCAMEILHKIRVALRNYCGLQTHHGYLARHILAKNLFGVDIVPMSEHICELRLWLELIQFFSANDPIPSLPNLDLNIQCGDSLADLTQYAQVFGMTTTLPSQREIAHLKHRYRLATGYTKRKLASKIQALLLQSSRKFFKTLLESYEHEFRDIERNSRSLFESGIKPDAFQKKRMNILEKHRENLKICLEENRMATFSYHIQFGDIMANGGFDMVLGNPPWFSLHTMIPDTQNVLKLLYKTATPERGKRSQSIDISALFVEKSLKCVRDGGIVTLLVPNKLFYAPSYIQFRTLIAHQSQILNITDWSLAQFNAFSAATYPASLTLRKCRENSAQNDLQLTWNPSKDATLTPFVSQYPSVQDKFTLRLGVKTSANDVFLASVKDEAMLAEVQFSHEKTTQWIEKSLIHPVLRGADIHAYSWKTPKSILFTHEWNSPSTPLKSLPFHAQRWFERHEEKLRKRKNAFHKPAHMLFNCHDDLQERKVVWKDISMQLEAAFIEDNSIIPLNTAYYIPVQTCDDGLLLTAYFNSKLAREYCRDLSEHAMNDYRRYFAWVVGQLPWFFDNLDEEGQKLKQQIIDLSRRCGEVSDAEREKITLKIDRLLARCLRAAHPMPTKNKQKNLIENTRKQRASC